MVHDATMDSYILLLLIFQIIQTHSMFLA